MIWKLIAKFCARPAVAAWLIKQAKKTPYSHIHKAGDVYMERYWLFNPYHLKGKKTLWQSAMARLPSARIHWIRRPDLDRHKHDHPWDARTIGLLNSYNSEVVVYYSPMHGRDIVRHQTLGPGDTVALKLGDYHSITEISPGGVWTLFITWKYQGTWGFLVDGKKVPYKTYLGE